jgi:ribosomal protein L37E
MICPRCGREQPTLASPCPSCGLLDSGAFNPGTTRPPEVVCAIDPHAGAETPESSKRPKPPQPYFCNDCGRRFYNIGWHCEACGSSNYEPVSSGLEPQATEPSRVASDIASSPLGKATSSLGPELRLAFMGAHRAWAKRFQPWLLMDEEWLNA